MEEKPHQGKTMTWPQLYNTSAKKSKHIFEKLTGTHCNI